MEDNSRKRPSGRGTLKVAAGYAVLGLTALGCYEGAKIIIENGPPPGTGEIGDALIYPVLGLPLSFLAVIGGLTGVSLIRRSSTCYQCHGKGKKREMVQVGVADGMMDSRLTWMHESCAKEYLNRHGTGSVRGPFTAISNSAARHTPKKTLERLSESTD
tara:strand:- start:503 stop:979 length:477 start_codon:yes stop_codon:yes gene_type:complete